MWPGTACVGCARYWAKVRPACAEGDGEHLLKLAVERLMAGTMGFEAVAYSDGSIREQVKMPDGRGDLP